VDYYIAPSPDQAQRIQTSNSARLLSFPDRAFVLLGWNQRRPPVRGRARAPRAHHGHRPEQAIVDGGAPTATASWATHHPADLLEPRLGGGADLAYDPEPRARCWPRPGGRRDADGILRTRRGALPLHRHHQRPGNQERQDILEIVQSHLRRSASTSSRSSWSGARCWARVNDPVRRDFDAVLIGWVTEFRIDDVDLFHCDKRQTSPTSGSRTATGASTVLLDTLPKIVDRDDSRPLWAEYQQLLPQDQPYTILYFTQRLEGVQQPPPQRTDGRARRLGGRAALVHSPRDARPVGDR
jgi:peptide/nickel transport system substrate-binding protein